MNFDVFLSHNSADKPAVRELKRLLKPHKLQGWIDADELVPGNNWQPGLIEGIADSKTFAVCIGPAGIGPWEDEEMQGALTVAVREKRRVIPVLLPGAPEKTELSLFLTNRTWVDLREGFSEEGIARFVWGVTGTKPSSLEDVAQSTAAQSVQSGQGIFSHAPERLIGREIELQKLDEAWNNPSLRVLNIVAWGGVGKTALVAHWMVSRDVWNRPDFERVFEWSFFSQGTRDKGDTASAEGFVAAALRFFGDEEIAQSAGSPWDKGAWLAQLVSQQRTLLVLDGIEPLQHPPGPLAGELKDPALATLLKRLARSNSGLCIVTTRERVSDLAPFRDTTAPEWQLQHLSIPAGVELLRTLGVRGTAAEFEQLVERVKGHALTLNLLGRYLARAHGGDIRKSDQVKFEKADAATQGGYAFKTIGAYERWLYEGEEGGARQLAVLRLLGLFDRPVDAGCMSALRDEPVITDLTEPLIGLDEEDWNLTLSSLSDCGLVSLQVDQSEVGNWQSPIDAHPLIREYFAKQLREKNPEGWRAAHRRLYEYLRETTKEGAEPTLEDLQPLYQAVTHGCQAALRQEAFDEVYRARIDRKEEFYSTNTLGAFGSDLGAVACFFEKPWSQVSTALTQDRASFLLNAAAFRLRALGRLIEALEPMRATLPFYVNNGHWNQAAAGATNLSELELTLGDVTSAVADGERAVSYADHSGDMGSRMSHRTTLADALHQAGRRSEAETLFGKAEEMEAERQPKYPLLSSLWGFRYCDLLLTDLERASWRAMRTIRDQRSEVTTQKSDLIALGDGISQRAAKTLDWWTNHFKNASLRTLALDRFTLSRVSLYVTIVENSGLGSLPLDSIHVDATLNGLRRAGAQEFIVRGLLVRAWVRFLTGASTGPEGAQEDLDEAWEIAERGPMRLFMADIHLYRARLFHAVKPYPWSKNPSGTERGPKDDLAAAKELIKKCGYWRRKEELEDAEEAAKNWD